MGESDGDGIARFLSTPIPDGKHRRAAEIHIEGRAPPFALQGEEENGNQITREPEPPSASIPPADELVAENGQEYERDVERVHHPPIASEDRDPLPQSYRLPGLPIPSIRAAAEVGRPRFPIGC